MTSIKHKTMCYFGIKKVRNKKMYYINKTKTRIINTLVWIVVFMALLAVAEVNEPDVGIADGNDSSQAIVTNVDYSGGQELLSIRFEKGSTIRAALRFLAAKYQKNIIPSSKVDGELTFTSLYKVTFDEAMEAILGDQFSYETRNGLVKVYTKDNKKRMKQEVFTLYYINAAEVQKLIVPLLSVSGVISASTAAMLDIQTGTGGDSYANHDTVVVYDYPENLKEIAGTIEKVDVRPPQVLLEVTMLEAKLDDQTQFGIDFSSIGATSIDISTGEGIAQKGLAGAGTSGLSAGFSIDNVTGFLTALESITDTTVLANPKMLVLNKQAGQILIGSEDGYSTVTQVNAEGSTQTIEFLESGTRLEFRAYVCKDGYVRLEVHPEQSTGAVELTGDFALPSKTTTQVSTNVMVKDGKTIAIGGLFKEVTTQTKSQVPVFGNLPLIGGIFKQTDDQTVRTELIILLTPHIIHEPEDIYGQQRKDDVERIVYGSQEEITFVGRSAIVRTKYEKAVKLYQAGDKEAALREVETALRLSPTHLDAIRLHEKIIADIDPQGENGIKRKNLEMFKEDDSQMWQRR